MSTEPMNRLQALFDALIRAMAEKLLLRFPHFRHPWRSHAAHTQPGAATRAQEQEARQAYTAGLREVIG